MTKKILYLFLTFVTFLLISLILFGGILKYSNNGGKKFMTIQKVANFIADIPDILRPSNIKKYFVEGEELLAESERHYGKVKFQRFQKTKTRDELLIIARYDGDLKRSIVEIVDLNNFNVIHSYKPNIDSLNSNIDTSREEFSNHLVEFSEKRHQMLHPLLIENGELVFNAGAFYKIDFCGNLIWFNDEDGFHHSIEKDGEGNFWTSTYMYPYGLDKKLVGDEHGKFDDDAITKVSESGKIIYSKSVSEIMLDNGLFGQVFGRYRSFLDDPIHVNDVEPVLSDGPYWKKGDLLISSNILSAIIHYRPKSNKILNYIVGPFSQQHDVDIISEKEISMFNNNSYNTINKKEVLTYSEIVIYDFETNKFSKKFEESMIENKFISKSQGVSDFLIDGSLMVEEQNHGRILFFDASGNLEWEYVNKANNGNVYLLSWSRIINDQKVIKNFKDKVKNTKCKK